MSNFDELDSPEEEYKPLDINVVRQMVPTYTSQKLCEMIVCDRYFGGFREVAVICMEELSKRRQNGDSFQFEKAIDDAFKTLPDLTFTNGGGVDIRAILQQSIKARK